MADAGLYSLEAAAAILQAGVPAVVAGTEAVLAALPTGPWIGGTMRYFMTRDGASESTSKVLVVPVDVAPEEAWIRRYESHELPRIVTDAPANGLSIVIIPSGSAAHLEYAERAPYFPRLFRTPIVGWISGVAVSELGTAAPLVFDGPSGTSHGDQAIVLHVRLPRGQIARIEAVNIFRGDEAGDVITFPGDGLEVRTCRVNGKERNFAQYLAAANVDTRLPLVADYAGMQVNTSFQRVDGAAGVVHLYAPVFSGIEYRIAAPVDDYADAFQRATEGTGDAAFACNCILNYLYGDLAGRRVGHITGPMTFGEIAYQLLNQTLVHVSIGPG
jgi:hypothetical protein